MVGEIFYWVFNMSLVAALTGAAVWLIRSIRRLPRRIAVLLWIIPFVRMLVPVGLNSPYSLMTLISRLTTRTVTVYEPVEGMAFSATNCIMAATGYFPITYREDRLAGVFAVAGAVWLTVAAAIGLILGVQYVSALRGLRGAVRLRDNVYRSDRVSSPAVYGIVRPRIVLPTACAEKDLRYVLMHERAHIRRRDNLWRVIALTVTAIHWFNPLAWMFLKRFFTDMELACDESVLARCGDEEAREYARTLLDNAPARTVLVSAFGGADLRTRIGRIVSFKPMTGVSLIGFSALAVAVAAVLLTNAG